MAETLEHPVEETLQFEDICASTQKANIILGKPKRWPAGKRRPAADQQDTHEGLCKGGFCVFPKSGIRFSDKNTQNQSLKQFICFSWKANYFSRQPLECRSQ